MPEKRCEETDLLVRDCAHCKGQVSAEEEAEEEGRVTGGIFGDGSGFGPGVARA